MTNKDTATFDSQVPAPVVTKSVQEPPTVNTASEPDTAKNNEKAGGPPSGFYIYLGPTIKGLIRNTDMYRGNRANALKEAQPAIQKYPLIKTLIVSGDYLPTARLKIKTPGNALHANYTKLAGQVKSGRQVNKEG